MGTSSKLLIALLLLLFFIFSIHNICNRSSKAEKGVTSDTSFVSDTTIKTHVDSTPVVINNNNLVDTPNIELVYIAIPAVIDTQAIIAKYFSCKKIVYHYRKDSAYDLVITDSNCMSELVNRNIIFKNLKPDSTIYITNTTTITTTKVIDKARWYVGVSSSALMPFAPGVNFAHKRFSANANYEPFKKQFQAGLYINIK